MPCFLPDPIYRVVAVADAVFAGAIDEDARRLERSEHGDRGGAGRIGREGVLSRAFQATLRQRGVDWIPSLEVGSLDLVVRYVAEGFGAGLALRHPRVELPATVKVLAFGNTAHFSYREVFQQAAKQTVIFAPPNLAAHLVFLAFSGSP